MLSQNILFSKQQLYDTNRRLVSQPQSAILGQIDLSDDYLLINHLILIYKFFIYNSRNRDYLNIEHLKAIIDKTKRIEEEIRKHELKKRSKYLVQTVQQGVGWVRGGQSGFSYFLIFYLLLIFWQFFVFQMQSK